MHSSRCSQGPRIALLVVAVWHALPVAVLAAPWVLDPTFGNGGIARGGFGRGQDEGYAMVVDGGKFVVGGGSTYGASGSDASLVRFNSDGSLDATFGNGGRVLQDFGTLLDDIRAIARQTDGKLVTVGRGNGMTVARFNTDGTLDPTFGGDGMVTVSSHDAAFAFYPIGVGVYPDGTIVAAGTVITSSGSASDFFAARFNSDGSLDGTFAGDGIVITPILTYDVAYGMVALADGRVLVAGESATSPGVTSIALVRYTSTGTLDSTFDGDGKVLTTIGGVRLGAQALALQTNLITPTRYIVCGYAGVPGALNFMLARYNENGSLDSTLDTDGMVTLSLATADDIATTVRVIYSGGSASRILVAGYGKSTGPGQPDKIIVAKTFLAGGLDATFDGDGFVVTQVQSGSDRARAILPVGGYVVAGSAFMAGTSVDLVTMRYTTTGALDAAWDGDGIKTVDLGDGRAQVAALTTQPDGKVLAAGYTSLVGSTAIAVMRFLPDGTPDPSFGGDGGVDTPIGTGFQFGAGVAVQGDGKIVTAGTTGVLPTDFALVRYNADGALDPTFSADGITTTDFGPGYKDTAGGVVIQSNGRIVVVGTTDPGSGNYTRFALARYMPDGSPDPSFSGDGKAELTIALKYLTASGVALQADGRILVVGRSFNGAYEAPLVARFHTDGLLDGTFHGVGWSEAPVSETGIGKAIRIQADGRIVIAGEAGFTRKFFVARFETDGDIDPAFGSGGTTVTPVGTTDTGATALAIQPDGTILAVGSAYSSTGYLDTVLARYNSNGIFVEAELMDLGGSFDDESYAAHVDGAGRVLVGGRYIDRFGVARFEGAAGTSVLETMAARTSFFLGHPFPNPTRRFASVPFVSDSRASVEAMIVDVAGRRVRTLQAATEWPAEGTPIVWDGTSEEGRAVAPGAYYIRVRQGEQSATRRVVLVR